MSNRDAEDTVYHSDAHVDMIATPTGMTRRDGTELAAWAPLQHADGASMGEVIHVAFGTEREWEQTHEKTVDGLVTIGTLFGDDETLMRAKADCVYQVLREIVEEVPSVQITTKLPENLSPEQLDALTRVIKDAALKGIEIAMTHSVQVLMGSIYDLCTSKLQPSHQ